MGAVNTIDSLNAMFKIVYSPDKIVNVVPNIGKIRKRIGFESLLGRENRFPVVLGNEAGVTYATVSDGAFDLRPSKALSMGESVVDGYQIALRAQIATVAAIRATKGKKAFDSAIGPVVQSLMDSISKRLEISYLYGATDLGTSVSSANSSATVTVATISAATWAPGIWAGMTGHELSAWGDTGEVNINAPLVITSVNPATRAITLTGNSTDIAALDSAIAGTGVGVVFRFYKSFTKEAPGLDKIITNDGTLFGISASTYDLWKGQAFDVAGSLTLAKLDDALTNSVSYGLEEDVLCIISPKTWSKLMTNESALRKYDASYTRNKAENGFESLVFYSQNGKVEVMPHPYCKQGEGFIVPPDQLTRIGSVDISFEDPADKGQYFVKLQDKMGFEIRCLSDQTMFCYKPAHCTKLSGITNYVYTKGG